MKAGEGETEAGANPNTFKNKAVASAPKAGVQDIIFAMHFDNPISTRTPKKDGFHAAVTPVITYDTSQNPVSVAPTAVWDAIASSLYDIVPSADYEWTKYDSVEAANACDNAAYNNNAGYTHGTDDPGEWLIATDPGYTFGASKLCDESWNIGQSGYTCVKITQRFTRPLAPTKETACDFAIDYVEHTVKIKIGIQGGATD